VGELGSIGRTGKDGNTVGDDCKSSKSVNAEKANTLGAVKVSMGRGFRFGTTAGTAVLA
jgi:hypothetical protein